MNLALLIHNKRPRFGQTEAGFLHCRIFGSETVEGGPFPWNNDGTKLAEDNPSFDEGSCGTFE
jgi:hypothetical protein